MSRRDESHDGAASRRAAETLARRQRQAAELRENLRRRKAQARGRAASPSPGVSDEGQDETA